MKPLYRCQHCGRFLPLHNSIESWLEYGWWMEDSWGWPVECEEFLGWHLECFAKSKGVSVEDARLLRRDELNRKRIQAKRAKRESCWWREDMRARRRGRKVDRRLGFSA